MTNKLTLEWIGTGAGLNPVLGNTSFMVRGAERTLLVDCGYAVTPKLFERNLIKEVTDIVLTHEHPDHIGGLGIFAQMTYFAYRNRAEARPKIYVATDAFAQRLWENSLKGGTVDIQSDENEPQKANLETFFKVQTGKEIVLPGFPKLTLFPTPHVQGMENYGVRFDNGIWYSGDTLELPPREPLLIFQDCQFYETKSDVHVSYDKLRRELPEEIRRKMYLVHLGGGWDKKDAVADGFAGFLRPGDKFDMETLEKIKD